MKDATGIPAVIREDLARLIERLRSALGDGLISVALYGEIAKENEYVPFRSELYALIVMGNCSQPILETLAAPLQQAQDTLNLQPTLLTEKELHRSTDVFPVKFLDMQEHYILLHGKDCLRVLKIAPDHLRLRCEQEIKNLLLRARQFYIQNSPRPERLERILVRLTPALFIRLRVLLRVNQHQAPNDRSELAQAAEQHLSLNGNTLKELLALHDKKSEPDTAGLKKLYGAFIDLLETAAEKVDQLSTST